MLGPTARRALTALATTLVAACALTGGTAWALPTFTPSGLTCTPMNGVTTRAGDEMLCRLDVAVTDGLVDGVTADIAIPPTTTFDPAAEENLGGVANDPLAPTSVHFDSKRLGFLAAGSPKAVSLRLRVRDDGTAKPGDPIAPVATIKGVNAETTVITMKTAMVVQPPAANLSPSHLDCTDDDGAPLRPGDAMSCALHLVNEAGREHAVDVTVQGQVPLGMAWSAGGTFHSSSTITWLAGALPGGVPSGPPTAPALPFRLTVAPDAAAGMNVQPFALVSYANAPSGEPGSASVVGPVFKVAPGPAVLTGSMLTCADTDGAPLFPGDIVQCTLTVVDAAGKEDVADLTGSGPVPAGTTAVLGATDASGRTLVFGLNALGSVQSGGVRATTFRLRVDNATAPGTTIAATARVTGRSVGTNLPVAHDLAAAPLTVTARPPASVFDPPGVVTAAGGSGAPATPAKPAAKPTPKPTTPAKSSRICKSRRTVTVTAWPPKGQRWKTVSAKFGSRRAKGKRWGKRRAYRIKLTFTGMPKGTMKVRITGRTTTGKTVKSTRSFRLCLPKLK